MVDIYKGTSSDKDVKDFLSEKPANESGTIPGTVGFGNLFGSSLKRTFTQSTITGRHLARQEVADEQQTIIDENNLDIDYTHGIRRIPVLEEADTLIGYDAIYYSNMVKQRERIEAVQRDRPELGLLTRDQLDDEVLRRHSAVMLKNQDLEERASFSGKTGSLVGSMVGFVKDPINAASFLVGGTAVKGASILTNFLRVGTAEALINTALETAQKPGEVELRRDLGQDVTGEDIAAELGVAAVAGFLLGGGIGAFISKLPAIASKTAEITRATRDSVQRFIKGTQDGSIKPKGSQQDAASILEEAVQIAEQTPEGMAQTTHFEKYGKARKQMDDGENIAVNEAESPSDAQKANESPDSAPKGSRYEDTPETEVQTQAQEINDVREALQASDVKLPEFDTDGNLTAKSGRATMDALEKERVEIDDIITCLGKS